MKRVVLIIWAIAACCVLALTVSSRLRGVVYEAVYPFENSWQLVKRQGVSRVKAGLGAARDAVTLESLRDEVARLRISSELQMGLLEENRQLRRQLGFIERSSLNLIAAPVLAKNGALGTARGLRIGKGSAQGVKRGATVLAPEGLVGRVDEVSLHTSTVLLISSPDCRTAAELPLVSDGAGSTLQVRGIVFGESGRAAGEGMLSMFWAADPLRMKYLQRDAVIAPRTEVLTSGLGGVFPAGLRLGWVLESFVGDSELYREATILPAVDFQSLTMVFVMMD